MSKQKVFDAAQKLVEADGVINLSRKILCETAGINERDFAHIMGMPFLDFVQGVPSSWTKGAPKRSKKRRANAQVRKNHIINTALHMAEKIGFNNVRRSELATEANVSPSLISSYFATAQQLRRAIMRKAITEENLKVLLQGLACNDPQAEKAPEEMRHRAAKQLME